jgi:hypothetical protein
VAVAAAGALGEALAERAAHRAGLRTDAVAPWVVVRGDDLPWLDGVVYLGALAGAPALLVPVHHTPAAPPDVVLAAVRRLAAPETGPFAVLPTGAGGVDVVPLVP